MVAQILTLLLLLTIGSFGFAKDSSSCLGKSHTSRLVNWGSELSSFQVQAFECAEQELVDPLLDPWKLESFVLKRCQLSTRCLEYLQTKASDVSNLDRSRFAKSNSAVFLWGEIRRFSAHNRVPMPQIRELPETAEANELYQLLKNEQLSSRALNKNETHKVVCAAVAGILGPAKLRGPAVAANLAKQAPKLKSVVSLSHETQKLIDKHRLPPQVINKFETWKKDIQEKGLAEVRKIPGYHDEPIHVIQGARSVRLNGEFRLFYTLEKSDGVETLRVLKITPHEY